MCSILKRATQKLDLAEQAHEIPGLGRRRSTPSQDSKENKCCKGEARSGAIEAALLQPQRVSHWWNWWTVVRGNVKHNCQHATIAR
jgi:hypothetical protein